MTVQSISIELARQRVDQLIANQSIDVSASDVWNELRFDDGWLLVSLREEVIGALYFVVMDSGEVHFESGSMPGNIYVQRYSAAGDQAELILVNTRISRTPESTQASPSPEEP